MMSWGGIYLFFFKKRELKRLMGDGINFLSKLAIFLCLVVTFYSAHLCSQCSVYPPQLSLISLVCAVLFPMSLLIHLGLRLMSGRRKRKWTKVDWPNNMKLETIVPTETGLQHNISDHAVQASGQTDRVPGRQSAGLQRDEPRWTLWLKHWCSALRHSQSWW